MINDHAFFSGLSKYFLGVWIPAYSYFISCTKIKVCGKIFQPKIPDFCYFQIEIKSGVFHQLAKLIQIWQFLIIGPILCDFMKFDKECLYLVYWTFDFCKWTCELFPLHKRHFSFSSHCVKRNPFHKFFLAIIRLFLPLTLHHNSIVLHRLQRSFWTWIDILEHGGQGPRGWWILDYLFLFDRRQIRN